MSDTVPWSAYIVVVFFGSQDFCYRALVDCMQTTASAPHILSSYGE